MILTRHLYEKGAVFQKMRYTILNKEKAEAMYWAFELYYSGFGEEVLDFVFQLFMEYYAIYYPKFKRYFQKKRTQWKNPKEYMTAIEKDRILSIIILNMHIMREGQGPDLKEGFVLVSIHAHRYYYKRENIVCKPYQRLHLRCLYNINDKNQNNNSLQINELFQCWEYFAYSTPIWKERIQKYKGYRNDKDRKIEFLNDTYMQEFYDKYGYEPDEQSLELQHRIWGISP